MLRIDAHQHFWKYDPVRDRWITEEMQVLQRDFMPVDLKPELDAHQMDGCMVVQSCEDEAEIDFQLQLAAENDFIKGIVGWIDLMDEKIQERLAFYALQPKLKGFRYMLQGEQDRALMLRPAFKRGMKALQDYGYTYDLLILPDQLSYALELAQAFPGQKMIVDHLAKPSVKTGAIADWQRDIEALACMEKVYCKVSGLITEANWHHWQRKDMIPYLDVVVQAFGTQRILFGSDWPVCLLAGSYGDVIGIVNDYFSSFSDHERADFYGNNAARFYNIIQP